VNLRRGVKGFLRDENLLHLRSVVAALKPVLEKSWRNPPEGVEPVPRVGEIIHDGHDVIDIENGRNTAKAFKPKL